MSRTWTNDDDACTRVLDSWGHEWIAALDGTWISYSHGGASMDSFASLAARFGPLELMSL